MVNEDLECAGAFEWGLVLLALLVELMCWRFIWCTVQISPIACSYVVFIAIFIYSSHFNVTTALMIHSSFYLRFQEKHMESVLFVTGVATPCTLLHLYLPMPHPPRHHPTHQQQQHQPPLPHSHPS